MREAWSLRDTRAHLALWIPALLWFSPQLLLGRVGYFRDTGLYFQPHKALIAEALRAGRLPEWNPFEYGGVPLLADPNFNLFHPLQLLCDLLPLPWGFGVFAFACALLGAYGLRALARTLGLGQGEALAAALFFAWSGPTVSFLLTGQMVASCTMPWLCAAGARLGQRRDRAGLLLCAIAACLQFIAGTPEVGGCAFAMAGALSLGEAWRGMQFTAGQGEGGRTALTRFSPTGLRRFLAPLQACALFLTATALGALVAAAQLWPSALFLRESSRGQGFSLAEAMPFSLEPLRLPGLLLPFFTGDFDGPGAPSWLLTSAEPPYVQEIYLGCGALLLAALGLRRARRAWPPLGVALLCGMVALGNHWPPARLLWQTLPLLRIVRFPEKLIVPLPLAVALLAGAGWGALSGRLRGLSAPLVEREPEPGGSGRASRATWRFAAIGAGLLALALLATHPGPLLPRGPSWPELRRLSLESGALASLALALGLGGAAMLVISQLSRGRISAAAAQGILAALLALELAGPALRLSRTAPREDWDGPRPLAEALLAGARLPASGFRISAQSSGMSAARLDALAGEEGVPRSLALYRLRRAALFDPGIALLGLRSDRGYSGFTPGGLHRFYQGAPGADALELLGVRFGVEFGGGASTYAALGFRERPDLAARALEAEPALEAGGLRVFEDPRALPTGWLAPAVLLGQAGGAAPRCADRAVPWLGVESAARLPPGLARGEHCSQIVEIFGSQASPRSAGAPSAAAASTGVAASTGGAALPGAGVTLETFAPERLAFQVDAARDSLLVTTETALSGWSARVDGAETPVLAADGALRACAVPPGRHRVEFDYRAPGLRSGLRLSGLGLGILALLAAWRRRPRRHISV